MPKGCQTLIPARQTFYPRANSPATNRNADIFVGLLVQTRATPTKMSVRSDLVTAPQERRPAEFVALRKLTGWKPVPLPLKGGISSDLRRSCAPCPVAQEQPRLSPQLRHLKHAPLRTVMWPHLGHDGASNWLMIMEVKLGEQR